MTEIVASEPCTIIKLHGSNGNYKLKNNDIITVLLKECNTQLKIKSHCKGIIHFKCKEGDFVNKDDVLCVLSDCPHDVVVFGICGLCSTSIEITNMGNGDIKCNIGTRMAMVHTNKFLVVNEKTAMEIALTETLSLLKKRKLSLLIDLDLTILHTTSSPISTDHQDIYHYTLKDDQSRYASVDYHTKMRPYLKQFLERMHTKFELHIYTFGNRSYAEKIREFIDPNKVLFGQRIITRDDSFDVQKKTANLKSLFPRGDNMVCIIDDRPEVWNYAPNFVHVKPYIYFPDAGDINNPNEKIKDPTLRGIMNYPTKDLMTSKEEKKDTTETDASNKKDEDNIVLSVESKSESFPDHDDYLLTLENILSEVHTRFYNQYEKHLETFSPSAIVEKKLLPDVKIIMKEMRLAVLKGCRISFSGLIPLNQKVKETHAYQILKNLGAHYFQNVSLPSLKSTDVNECKTPQKYTTHLISHSDGTKKMKQVRQYIKDINKLINENPDKLSPSVHKVTIVNIYWLWHCHFLWSRMDENQFLFLPNLQQLSPPAGVSEFIYEEDDLSQHSSTSGGGNKRPHSDDEGMNSEVKKSRQSESEDEFMKTLDEVNDDSVASHSNESESSYDADDDDWPDNNAILHYTDEQKSEMLKEVEDAINEEKLEHRRSPSSENYQDDSDNSSSSRSCVDNGSDQDGGVKNPPKNWEKKDKSADSDDDNSDEDSSGEHEWDYGDFEENYKRFAVNKNDRDSDSELSFADDL